MRDEDLKNLPRTIDRETFHAALESIGIPKETLKNIKAISADQRYVYLTVYWLDKDGRKPRTDFSRTQVLVPETTIEIPLTSSPPTEVPEGKCWMDGPDGLRCERAVWHAEEPSDAEHAASGPDGVLHKW